MKKLVFASLMALVSIGLVIAPPLRAQDTGTIQIKDPAEFNAYQNAYTQTDPKAKAAALEDFLTHYPQSVVKKAVLDILLDTYQGLGDQDHMLSVATRELQLDPGNPRAIFVSVYVKKIQCTKSVDQKTGVSSDPQTCDDAAALARKGLATPKPAGTSDDAWKQLTTAAFPIYHSAVAADDYIVKKDYKAAESEYKAELMLYTDDQSKTTGLPDTLLLAQAYSLPGAGQDLVQAVWFYSRVWDYAPAAYKAQIEPKLEYYYKKYHGKLDGLDSIKTQAAVTTFPPATFHIDPAKSPAEQIHDLLQSTPDLRTLALADKETVLALGSKDDADKLWALLKDQQTPVPGTILDASADALKVIVTSAAKSTDYTVALTTPAPCASLQTTGTVKELKAYVLANGVKADTDKIEALSPDSTKPVTRIVVEGTVSVIKVAVTQDAKDAKIPDFIVTLKEPVSCREINAIGPDFGLSAKGEAELDGTYDSYKQIPASATTAQAAEIAVRDGFIQEKKKSTAPAHKPAAGHRPAAAH
ncbi:MAG: hypothetical protein ABSF28_12400 [Terracidiphilus sp.]|jgi:hypothetical protein